MEHCSICGVELDPDDGPYLRTFHRKGKAMTSQIYCDRCAEVYFGVIRVSGVNQ